MHPPPARVQHLMQNRRIGPRWPREPPNGLIMRSLGSSRPAHTPQGHSDRLGSPVLTCTCHPQPSRRPGSHSAPRRWRSETAWRESCGSLAGKNGDHHRHQGRGAGSHNVCRGKHGLRFGYHARILGIPTESWEKGAVQLTPKLALGGPRRPRTGSSGTPQALPARHTHPGDTVTGWVARG